MTEKIPIDHIISGFISGCGAVADMGAEFTFFAWFYIW